jgi:hypothetical protein
MARIKKAKTGKPAATGGGISFVFSAAAAKELADYRAAKKELSKRYLSTGAVTGARALSAISPAANSNVVGVGIGEKLVDGLSTGIRSIKIFVKLKLPVSQILAKNVLPKTIGGLPVDVEQTGEFRRLAKKKRPAAAVASPAIPDPRTKIRPAQPGCSVGFEDPNQQFTMAGTFGALVEQGSDQFILSNNHVLADEGQLPLGAPIFQPGLLDDGDATTDQIAELSKFEPLAAGRMNKVDCAIARVIKANLVRREILFIGPPQGTGVAQNDMIVHKFGRTTSYSAGRVTSIDTDVTVNYETGSFQFQEQMIIVGLNGQPFSAAGDSGSLILERATQNAVGLLFAGSPSHTIANHISDVLQTLGVTLA